MLRLIGSWARVLPGAFCTFTGPNHYSSYLHSADHCSPFPIINCQDLAVSPGQGTFASSYQFNLCITFSFEVCAHLQAMLTGELLTPSNVLIFTSMMESFILFQRRPSCGLCCPHPSALLTPPPRSTCGVQVCSCSLQKTWKCPSSSITQ